MTVERLEELLDKLVVCIESQYLIEEFIESWTHDISPVIDRGVSMYRAVTYGIARRRGRRLGFTAVTVLAGLGEEDVSPVETRFMLSDGRVIEIRPEVDLEKCLKSFGWRL